MCLYPRLIKNKKYTENKKNGGIIPAISDTRVLAVPVGCGECMECRKKKAREWQIRLSEEIRTNKNGIFVTLTFSNEAYAKYANECKTKGYDLDNEIATRAMRHFLERWRKKYKRSVKHWMITELGHNGTENIHMHGIIFTDKEPNEIKRIWQNGYVWLGNEKNGKIENYVTLKTINYIIKYVSKSDELHVGYKSKVLSSKGIGKGYMERKDVINNYYKPKNTDEAYRLPSGYKSALPIYYRNKIYTEEERELLWLEKLDKNERWVGGERIDISENEEDYIKTVKWYRERNERLGYGGAEFKYDQIKYQLERREKLQKQRIEKGSDTLVAREATPSHEEAHNGAMQPSKNW